MTGSYAEASVKRITTPGTIAAKVGLILGACVLLAAGFLASLMFQYGYFVLLLAFGGIIALFYVLPMFNVEYEYVFVDGQLDFDIIYNGNKRKHSLRIDFDTVELMAPEKSHELDSLNRANSTTKDFSSRNPEAQGKYVVFWRSGEKLTKIIFEPGDKIIEAIKYKCPRKLKSY